MSRAVRSSSFVVAFLMLVGGAALVTLVPACGARGPLDDDGPLDGSAGLADVGAADATSEDAGPPGLDAAPLVDAAP